MKKVYSIKSYSKEYGIGALKVIAGSPAAVINYLTYNGRLEVADEFGKNINEDWFFEGVVLRITEQNSELLQLLGREPETEYYIIHSYDVVE